MELLKYDENAPKVVQQKPRGDFFMSLMVLLIALVKGLSGLIGGFLVATAGLVALPLNAARDCYKGHCWVWEILRGYSNKE